MGQGSSNGDLNLALIPIEDQRIYDLDFAGSVRLDSPPGKAVFGSFAGRDLVDHHIADFDSTGQAKILVQDSCFACMVESDCA